MLTQTMRIYDLLDDGAASGRAVTELFKNFEGVTATSQTIAGEKGSTDFVKIVIRGLNGKSAGGLAPTLGIVGRLGGVGARPARIGLTSDGDGCAAALAAALKLADMRQKGDALPGDVIVTTHVCPNAPTLKHEPVDFMDSPVDMAQMNACEVTDEMDAILSIDTTKGNRIINRRGFAISPTVKEGWILHVSEDLLRIMEMTTGELPATFPITMQDITPYGNGLYHLNSIVQPCVATRAPVVGVAITTTSMVPGCGTGASHEVDIAEAARFAVETAKEFTRGTCRFYDADEFARIEVQYGRMRHLQACVPEPSTLPKARKIGTITIGQAPRADIAPVLEALLPAGVTCRHAGVLDGLTVEEIEARFAPKPGEGLLTSRLLDGSAVVMGKSAVRAALQEKIAQLESEGCETILLLCTGEFDGLRTQKARLIEPDHVIPGAVAALLHEGVLGVMVPLIEQANSEARKWEGTGLTRVFAAASPYTATPEEVKAAAKALVAQGADAIVLDCMGYRLDHKALCREAVDVPVFASTDTMLRLLSAML